MPNMGGWNWVLLGIGVLVAVSSLVRLMLRRRDEVLEELTAQAKDEQHKKRLAEQVEKKKQKKSKAA